MGRIVKAEVKGIDDLQKAFKEQPEKVRLGIIDALEVVTKLLLNRAQAKILKGSKTGRIYKRRGVKHQASAAGESPAQDRGKLLDSGKAEVIKESLWGIVSFTAFYARMLEWGTRKMRPRPFLLPTVDDTRGRIGALFASRIKARLKK